MNYSTILFDFDGTITPSLPLWLRAYQFALETYGIAIGAKEVVDSCFYRSWSDVVAHFDLSCEKEFGRLVHEGLENAFDEAKLFENVPDVLEELLMRNVKLGIVTSSMKRVVSQFLTAQGLDRYFTVVITADDITNFKPHPEPVFEALRRLEGLPESCLFIGDSSVDMMAATNAGTSKCLFFPQEHLQFYYADDPRLHQPDLVFERYSELMSLLVQEPAVSCMELN